MKNSEYLGKSLLSFLFSIVVLATFAGIGWYLGQPYGTVSAIFTIGFLGLTAFLICVSGFGYHYAFTLVNYSGSVFYIFGGLSFLYLMGVNVWKKTPYFGHRWAWITIIAVVFTITHSWRHKAAAELAEQNALDETSDDFEHSPSIEAAT